MPGHVQVSIRDSEPSDETFIRELGRTAFDEYSSQAEHATLRMANEAPTLIALQAGQRVGFAIVQVAAGSAHLAAIAVVEAARGTGTGAALLRASERLARARGARALSATTADSNLAALDLFLKHGFRPRPSHGGHYARGQRTIELEKRL